VPDSLVPNPTRQQAGLAGPVQVAAAALRGLTRRWSFRTPAAAAACDGDLTALILSGRGLDADAAAFLDPKLTHLLDPEGIPDLGRAAGRLLDALRQREPIVIYGDYDVDGITATAILYHTFKAIAPDADVRTYVPHRLDEGYGLNVAAIEQLAAEGARVIVSVDCGVTAIEPARAARRAGVDLIITDHHNPPARIEDLPDAYAIVHPRRPDSTYPFGELCGSGVAYKLAWRLATLDAGSPRALPAMRTLLVELLSFAALGAIADVVPLVGENRVIVKFGLERIKRSPILGLRALVEASGLGGEKVGAFDVGFKLAPRLNASGRMAHASAAVELFTVATAARAASIAEDLTRQNNERRAVEKVILDQAVEAAEAAGMTNDDRRAIVLADERWHAGVVGIVCSRLVERFGRPAILLHTDGSTCHGSGRSIDGFNLHGGLVACADLLDKFGGHDMAAGLRVSRDNLPAFVDRFTLHANAHIEIEHLIREVTIDATVIPERLTVDEVQRLHRLEPFGRGNPSVHIRLPMVRIDAPPTPMGKGGEHLSLSLRGHTRAIRVIGWRWGEWRPKLAAGQTVDAIIKPSISTWGGKTSVEGELVDLRLVEGRAG